MKPALPVNSSVGALRCVLLQLDATLTNAARLLFARRVALRHDAALCAMFVGSRSEASTHWPASESNAALLQQMERGDIDRTSSLFDDALAQGVHPVRWLSGGADPVGAFCRQALYADLLVLGQHDASIPSSDTAPADFVESVVMASGKPALILPLAGDFGAPDRDVLIGWNATPQAARAVTAALPWLRIARRVHVLEAAGEAAPQHAGDLDIVHDLHLHGIESTLHRDLAAPTDTGEVLLSFASAVGADLLVMGCYGHHRARELVLGGASRTVLGAMTLPVLMVH